MASISPRICGQCNGRITVISPGTRCSECWAWFHRRCMADRAWGTPPVCDDCQAEKEKESSLYPAEHPGAGWPGDQEPGWTNSVARSEVLAPLQAQLAGLQARLDRLMPGAPLETGPVRDKSSERLSGNRPVEWANATGTAGCWLCGEEHELGLRCPTFQAMTVEQRFVAVKQNHRCTCCLQRHLAKECRNRQQCIIEDCRYYHHPSLHEYPEWCGAVESGEEHMAEKHSLKDPIGDGPDDEVQIPSGEIQRVKLVLAASPQQLESQQRDCARWWRRGNGLMPAELGKEFRRGRRPCRVGLKGRWFTRRRYRAYHVGTGRRWQIHRRGALEPRSNGQACTPKWAWRPRRGSEI